MEEQKKDFVLKKINDFKMNQKEWMLRPFFEGQHGTEPEYFTNGSIYTTNEPETFFVVLQHIDSAKILHFQAFFILNKHKIAGYEEEFELKAAGVNRFRCGWLEKDSAKIPKLREKLIKYIFKRK
jgi:hypothetical protein